MVPPSVVGAGHRWRATARRSQRGASAVRAAPPPFPLVVAALLLLAAAAAVLSPTAALQLVVPFASRKCISEDLPPSTHVRGDLRVAAGDGDMTLDLFVTDTRGVVVYHASNVISSAFTFVTSPPSSHSPRTALAPYRFCFHHQAHPHEAAHRPGVERRVGVVITQERHEPRVPDVATSVHVSAVEMRMREVEELVEGLVSGLDAAGQAATDVEAIQARVRRWVSGTAVLGCVVILGVGAIQVWYLRRMFRKKRLM